MAKEKNVKARPRPLSPHLQVYKPQLTSFTSIVHRGSIVAMFFISLLFVHILGVQSFGVECKGYEWLTQSDDGKFAFKILLSLAALAASYWVCATIRHLFFDIGKGFDIPTAYKTGVLSIIAALALAAYIINFGIL